MKFTFLHVVGYLTAGLVIVSHMAPAVVVALIGPAAGPYAVPAIAIAGAAVTFLHQIGVIPGGANTGSNQGAGTKTSSLLLFLALPLALLMLGGCTALGNLATPAANPLVQIGVDVGVATAVGSGASAHAKAQGISAAASAALTLDTASTSVALTALQSAVDAQIAKLSLPPADALAFGVLTQTMGGIITQALGGGSVTTQSGTVTAAAQAEIAVVLKDVISACAVY